MEALIGARMGNADELYACDTLGHWVLKKVYLTILGQQL